MRWRNIYLWFMDRNYKERGSEEGMEVRGGKKKGIKGLNKKEYKQVRSGLK